MLRRLYDACILLSLSSDLFPFYRHAPFMPRKTDGARDPLGYPRGIGQIFLGACADDCQGFQGAEALRHRWNWNKWGRNKSPHNDNIMTVC